MVCLRLAAALRRCSMLTKPRPDYSEDPEAIPTYKLLVLTRERWAARFLFRAIPRAIRRSLTMTTMPIRHGCNSISDRCNTGTRDGSLRLINFRVAVFKRWQMPPYPDRYRFELNIRHLSLHPKTPLQSMPHQEQLYIKAKNFYLITKNSKIPL